MDMGSLAQGFSVRNEIKDVSDFVFNEFNALVVKN